MKKILAGTYLIISLALMTIEFLLYFILTTALIIDNNNIEGWITALLISAVYLTLTYANINSISASNKVLNYEPLNTLNEICVLISVLQLIYFIFLLLPIILH